MTGDSSATGSSSGLPPSPSDVFARSEAEGRQRLTRSILGQISTGFTAGFNIVFAVVALGITHHLVSQQFGTSMGQLAGAVAFGVGLTFLVVGRTELFTENFLERPAGDRVGEVRPRVLGGHPFRNATYGYDELAVTGAIATAGSNLVGGVLFVTLLRAGQAKG